MDENIREDLSEAGSNTESNNLGRRGFLVSLRKWSMAVIGTALFGGIQQGSEGEANAAAAWANRAGGGGAWANRAGGTAVAHGGGAWANRAGAGGAWANRGAAWANRGAAWVNRF